MPPAVSAQQDMKTKINSEIDSVTETNEELRKKMSDLEKQNAAKRAGLRNAELKNKLAEYTNRQEQLEDKVKILEKTGQVISDYTAEIIKRTDDSANIDKALADAEQ